jgi:hypothetical protein
LACSNHLNAYPIKEVLFVIFVVGSGDLPEYTPEAGIAKGRG